MTTDLGTCLICDSRHMVPADDPFPVRLLAQRSRLVADQRPASYGLPVLVVADGSLLSPGDLPEWAFLDAIMAPDEPEPAFDLMTAFDPGDPHYQWAARQAQARVSLTALVRVAGYRVVP